MEHIESNPVLGTDTIVDGNGTLHPNRGAMSGTMTASVPNCCKQGLQTNISLKIPNDSVALFLAVGTLETGSNLLFSSVIFLVATGKNLPGVKP